ncbi:MAG: MarR family transcriptional regulator [Desulfobulbaceae bacterium]|nr:MarR family transcriptional regulator [Desulfobulbaceae bacterium]
MNKHLFPPITLFGHKFAMLHRLQMSMCRSDIQAAGIQPSWFPFLARLMFENEPVTQDYLSKTLAIDKGTTARAINQLEQNGYVTRKPNPQNRRQNLVTATPKAIDITQQLLLTFEKSLKIFMEGFSKEERTTTLALMDRMINNAKKALYEEN